MNQVVLAIKLGYDVRILTEEVCDISENANLDLFRKYQLEDKLILENYKIPNIKAARAIKALRLILKRPDLVPSLLRFYWKHDRKGFFVIFQFFFYRSLRKYDIIHIQFGTNKSPIDILKNIEFLKSKIITSFHGYDLYFPINNRIPNNGYYNLLFDTADSLVANTPFLKEKLIKLGAPPEKIKTIPVAVNTQFFKPNLKKDIEKKIRLVTVGRMDELKGQEYGIRVVNRLIREGMEIEYLLAGGGIYERRLRELVEELEIDKSVFFVGNLDQKRVCTLLQASDIFLMTSVINRAGMEESQGLVTAEAQACGLPVVAFDTGGVKYTLIDGETGFLCKEKDIDDVAVKLELLINDSKLRMEMGTKAKEFIEKEYSEISLMNKWREIYG